MMTAWPVHMPVGELLLGGGAHRCDLDLEVKVLAGERMIAIERHHVATCLGDGDGTRALRRLRLEPHADAYLADAFERAPRYALHELAVVLAVAIGRGNLQLHAIARTLSRQLALEPRDKLTVAMQIRKRLTVGRPVDHLAPIVTQRVVNTDDLVLADGHLASNSRERVPRPPAECSARSGLAPRIPLRLAAARSDWPTRSHAHENHPPGRHSRLSRRLRHDRPCCRECPGGGKPEDCC